MKKFKYRLQALLKMKEHIEKERQKLLATSAKKVQNQQEHLKSVEDDRNDTVEHQRENVSERFTVAEMLVVSRYLHKLKRESILGEELLRALKQEEEAKRQELLKATRERKKYEKLREVQQDKHNSTMETVLAKENDETGVNTFRQKTKERS